MENLDFSRIHRFRYDDLKVLLDVNSGSVHVIDQPTWDFFNYLAMNSLETAFTLLSDQYSYPEADAVLDKVSSLMMAGQLFTNHADEAGPDIAPLVRKLSLQMANEVALNDWLTDEDVFAVCKEYETLGARYAEVYKNNAAAEEAADCTLSMDVLSNETCASCWARFYCSGGCNADLVGGVTEPDSKRCTLQKKRVETAIGVWALLHAEQNKIK